MKKNTLIMDLPPIDYTSTEDRAILRWKGNGRRLIRKESNQIYFIYFTDDDTKENTNQRYRTSRLRNKEIKKRKQRAETWEFWAKM